MPSSSITRYMAFAGGAVALVIVGIFLYRTSYSSSVKLAELIDKTYPVAQTTEVSQSPSAGAASVTRLREGAEVLVVGEVEGDHWYQIQLPDKTLAYVPVTAIPAANDTPQPQPAQVSPPAGSDQQPGTGSNSTPDSTVQFDAANDLLSVVRRTTVFLGPNKYAPPATTLESGAQVQVIAKSTDGAWAWVSTSDGNPAYVAMADLGHG